MKLLPLLMTILLAGAGFASTGSYQASTVGFRHERGVESRMVVTVLARQDLLPWLALDAGVGLNMFGHDGLAGYGLGAEAEILPLVRLRVRAAVQHDQWNDWRIGENRVLGMLAAEPLDRFELGAGMAWRAPVYDPKRYASPLEWQSDAPEWNLVYHLGWRFLETGPFVASAVLSNLDDLRLQTPHHISFRAEGSWRLDQNWQVVASCGTGVKGLSGLLFSVSEVSANAGVRHAF